MVKVYGVRSTVMVVNTIHDYMYELDVEENQVHRVGKENA